MEMKFVKVTLDLSGVVDIDDFYQRMSDLFQFPSFFGKNIHALIDCLFNLRYPDSGMTGFNVSDSECLLVETLGFSSLPRNITEILTRSVEFVNLRYCLKNQPPLILLLLTAKE